jgi:uracil-DNA glycosylase
MKDGIPVMPTFHLSYVARFPPAGRDVVADLRAVAERFGPSASHRCDADPATSS